MKFLITASLAVFACALNADRGPYQHSTRMQILPVRQLLKISSIFPFLRLSGVSILVNKEELADLLFYEMTFGRTIFSINQWGKSFLDFPGSSE